MTNEIKDTSKTFYKLTNPEVHFIKDILNKSELIIYFHLRTLNPFSDKYLKTTTKEISEILDFNIRTVQKAIAKLKNLNLINWNILSFEYKMCNFNGEQSDAETNENSQERTEIRCNEQTTAYTNNNSPTTPETLAVTEPQNSKTLKTNKTLSDLSDSEAPEIAIVAEEKEKEGEVLEIKKEELEELRPSVNEVINSEKVINESPISQKEKEISVTSQQPTLNNNPSACSISENKTGNLTNDNVPSNYDECPTEFLEWKAKNWARHFGYSLQKGLINLRRHLTNKPEKIKGYWQEWKAEKAIANEKAERLIEFEGKWIKVSEYQSILESRKPKDDDKIPVNNAVTNMIGNFLNAMSGKANYAT